MILPLFYSVELTWTWRIFQGGCTIHACGGYVNHSHASGWAFYSTHRNGSRMGCAPGLVCEIEPGRD